MFSALKRLVGIPTLHNGTLTNTDVDLRLLDRFGNLPSVSCISHDPVQSVLCLASHNGLLRLIGLPPIERTISCETKASVLDVYWFHERAALVVVFSNNVEIVSLKEGRSIHNLALKDEITASSYIIGTPYLYIGDKRGSVRVLDLKTAQISPFSLELANSPLAADYELLKNIGSNEDFKVVAIAPNPEQDGIVLVGYANDNIVEFDIKTKRAVKAYTGIANEKRQITCLQWHSGGEKFVSGHFSGETFIWKRKSSKPESSFIVSQAGGLGLRPVKNVHYTSVGGQKFLAVVGGNKAIDQTTVTFQIGKQKTRQTLSYPSEIVQSLLLYREPHNNAVDPAYFLALTQDGGILIHSIDSIPQISVSPQPLKMPINWLIHTSPIVSSLVHVVPASFLEQLQVVDSANEAWPFQGGCLSEQKIAPIPKLLITAHENGAIIFSDASGKSIIPLQALTLPFAERQSIVTSTHFCVQTRTLTVGLAAGDVLIFRHRVVDTTPTEQWNLDLTPSTPAQPSTPPQPLAPTETATSTPQDKPNASPATLAPVFDSSPSPKNDDGVPSPESQPAISSPQPLSYSPRTPRSMSSMTLLGRIHVHESVSVCHLESQGILAIGTSNGTTRLINVAGPSPVELFVSRQAEPVPVVKTLFVETSVPNLGDCAALLTCLENGAVLLSSVTHSKTIGQVVKKSPSSLLTAFVVNERGRVMSGVPRQAADPSLPASPKWLLMCFVNSVVVYTLPDFEEVDHWQLKAPVATFGIVRVTKDSEEECGLVAIDQGSHIHVHAMMDFPLITSQSLWHLGVETDALLLRHASISPDGVMWLLSPSNQIYRCSLFPRSTDAGVAVPRLWIDGVEIAAKKPKERSALKSLLGSSPEPVLHHQIFFPQPMPPAQSSRASSPPVAPAGPAKRDARSELGLTADRPRSDDNGIEKGNVRGQVGEVASIMAQNKQMLLERGERLEDLRDRTDQMKAESSNFAKLASQLAQKEKSNSTPQFVSDSENLSNQTLS